MSTENAAQGADKPRTLTLTFRVETIYPTTSGGEGRQLYDLELRPLEGEGIERVFLPIRLTVDERWGRALRVHQQITLRGTP